MKNTIEDYANCFAQGGSEVVWTRIQDRCLTDAERRREVDGIEAHGWFVKRHFGSDGDYALDDALFEPAKR